VRAVVFCVLPFAGSATVIIVLAAIQGVATGFFRPAVYASTPNLVDDAELPAATSLLQTVENLTWMIGPVVGGVILSVSGPNPAYWINALTFVVSALLLARIPAKRLQVGHVESRGHWGDIVDGFHVVLRSRSLLTVLIVWNVVTLGVGAINVAEVALAKVSLDAGNLGFGVLLGGAGLGLTLGSFVSGHFVDRLGTGRVYFYGIALMGGGYAIAALAPSIYIAVPAVVIASFGNGAAVVCNALFIQRGAPDELRGRAFTVIMSSSYATLVVGMVAAGWLTDAYGARLVWGAAAAIYLAGALLTVALAPRQAEQEKEAIAA
jgi:MFS family permease